VLPCSFPTLYETEGRFSKLANGSCIVKQTLGFNDVYKFGFSVRAGTYFLGLTAPPPLLLFSPPFASTTVAVALLWTTTRIVLYE